ncbi:MAG: hypothetical protein IKJ13_00195 [Clostridia bacterium]|nr:hypothetical protein [Clostridia bacterium]
MKNRTAKIVSLIVILAALITCMVVMNVSAETAEPQIEHTNLIHGDQIQIMFATNIPTTEALGDLKVAYYKENPDENPNAEVFYATALPQDSKYNYEDKGVTYWTFYTDGIPASQVSAERFATVFYGETVPTDATYKSYSVMEYLFSRLYKQDFINKADGTEDGDRKQLYLNMIDYTALAQKVLVNNNKDITEKISLITEYNYVYAEGASIDGGGETLILKGNGEVTLTGDNGSTDFTDWMINTYAADGTLLKSETATSNIISVTSHTVILPPQVDTDPTYIEFEDWALGNVTTDSNDRVDSYVDNGGSAEDYKIIVDEEGNKKLQFSGTGTNEYNTIKFGAHTSSDNANVTVLEFDMECLDIITTSQGYMGYFDFCVEDEVKLQYMLYAESGAAVRVYTATPYYYPGGGAFAAGYNHMGDVARSESDAKYKYKFTLKVEYYHSIDKGDGTKTGMIKFYVDGENIGDVAAAEITENITTLNLKGAKKGFNVIYNIDNLRIENTYIEYVAKQ